MQLTKKQIIILIIIVLLFFVVIFSVFFLKQKIFKPIDETKQDNNIQISETQKKEDFDSVDFETKAEVDIQSQIISTARNFIERYGSWSNQADDFYELIAPMITDSMYSQANSYISNNENFKDKDQYYGITTKALNITVLESNNDFARVSCSLQQVENKNNTENIFYKTAEVSLVYQNDKWLANSVLWK